jgi:DNA-binding MarR family transcriptional regulator
VNGVAPPSSRPLLHLFLHIGRLLEGRLRAPLAQAGVHHGQGRVLDALLRHGPMTVGELAAGLHVAQPTATVMAQRMQSARLLERWVNAEDARRVSLAWEQLEVELCQSLPDAERTRLQLLLEGLRDGLGGGDPRFATSPEEDPDAPVTPSPPVHPWRRPSIPR